MRRVDVLKDQCAPGRVCPRQDRTQQAGVASIERGAGVLQIKRGLIGHIAHGRAHHRIERHGAQRCAVGIQRDGMGNLQDQSSSPWLRERFDSDGARRPIHELEPE